MKKLFDRGFRNPVGLLAVVSIVMLLAAAMVGHAGESKYAAHATAAAVTFGPGASHTVIESVYGVSDKLASECKIYARTGNAYAPTSTPTNGATVIAIANTGTAVSTNTAVVVYVHKNGTLDVTTVSAATTTNVTLAAGISAAGATGDYLYALSQQGSLAGTVQATAGITNILYKAEGGAVFESPGNSPVRVVLDGTAAAKVTVTAD